MLTIELAGFPVQITLPFAALVACMLLLDSDRVALYALFASAVHEGGHLLALMRLGCKPESMRLTLSGAELRLGSGLRLSYAQECVAAASGPAANALLGGALLIAARVSGGTGALYAGAVSLLLGAFNLLPIAALDGGQLLKCLLRRFFSPASADRILYAVSFTVLVPVSAAAFFFLFRSRLQFSLVFTSIYLICTIFESSGR